MKKSILIIEDDLDFAKTLSEFLTLEGHSVNIIQSLKDLPAAIRTHQVELIVCDIFLKDSLGSDMLKVLTFKNIQLPIIFMTGNDNLDLSKILNDKRVLDVLIKPFKNNELINLINKV